MNLIKYILTLFIFLTPYLVQACSVCGGANSPAQTAAYLNTTFFLAGMPIAMASLLFYWIYQRYKSA